MKKEDKINKEVNEPVISDYLLKNGLGLIRENSERIKDLCSSHLVASFFLFGSAAIGPFKPESDFDFLVKFKPMPLEDYFENYIDLKIKLESLLNRKVDLVEVQTLKNRFLIQSIGKSKVLIYGS